MSSESELELYYDCNRALLGHSLAERFRPLSRDAEVEAWLAQYRERPHGVLMGALGELLSRFVSSYDVHGWLGSYTMHLLSAQAYRELLGGQLRQALLDVGAGAGYVTEHARPLFREILCTETSAPLRRRLTKRGFTALQLDLTEQTLGRSFDVVSCLNVLDRTARPRTLLQQLVAHLAPDGLLLLAMPLPLRPHVHVAGGTVSPQERLPGADVAQSWERAARSVAEGLLMPAGLKVERLARVPYLSRGDAGAAVYVLDDAVFVCRRA